MIPDIEQAMGPFCSDASKTSQSLVGHGDVPPVFAPFGVPLDPLLDHLRFRYSRAKLDVLSCMLGPTFSPEA